MMASLAICIGAAKKFPVSTPLPTTGVNYDPAWRGAVGVQRLSALRSSGHNLAGATLF